VNKALAFLVENVNFVAFACGFAVLYVGVASLSRPAANVVAGGLVMVIAAWPYLRDLRVRKP
jgi:hypothetical protein